MVCVTALLKVDFCLGQGPRVKKIKDTSVSVGMDIWRDMVYTYSFTQHYNREYNKGVVVGFYIHKPIYITRNYQFNPGYLRKISLVLNILEGALCYVLCIRIIVMVFSVISNLHVNGL